MATYEKGNLAYNSETGEFTRISGPYILVKVGTIKDGYLHIKFEGKSKLAHRLAWYFVHGEWPSMLDHINRDKLDNRICNLHPVTNRLNTLNKYYEQPKGAYKSSNSNRWYSTIRIRGRQTYLGYFDTKEEAQQAYAKALAQLNEGAPA